MKQTYKKLVGLLLAIICVFGMTACGNEKDEFRYITDEVVTMSEETAIDLIEQFAVLTDANWKNYLNSPDDFSRVTAEAWVEQTEVLGQFVDFDESKMESEANEEELQVTVSIPAQFEKNTGTISIVFNYIKSFELRNGIVKGFFKYLLLLYSF